MSPKGMINVHTKFGIKRNLLDGGLGTINKNYMGTINALETIKC